MTENPPEPATPAPKYNQIYEKLSADESVVGKVAYALYKQNKREWNLNYQARCGAPPTQDKIDAHVIGITKYDLARYTEQAEEILAGFAHVIGEDLEKKTYKLAHESAITKAATTAFKEFKSEISKQSGFWYSIGMNMLGAFAYSFVLLVVFLVIVYLKGGDLMTLFNGPPPPVK